jgi:hypothetical protein
MFSRALVGPFRCRAGCLQLRAAVQAEVNESVPISGFWWCHGTSSAGSRQPRPLGPCAGGSAPWAHFLPTTLLVESVAAWSSPRRSFSTRDGRSPTSHESVGAAGGRWRIGRVAGRPSAPATRSAHVSKWRRSPRPDVVRRSVRRCRRSGWAKGEPQQRSRHRSHCREGERRIRRSASCPPSPLGWAEARPDSA